MSISVRQLRSDLYRLIDRVIESGEPLEVERNGRVVIIAPSPVEQRLSRLVRRPEVIVGDPEALVELGFVDEWQP